MLPSESMVPVSNFSASEPNQTNFLNYTPPCVPSSFSFKTGGVEGVFYFSPGPNAHHTHRSQRSEKKRGARLHPQPVQTKGEENTAKTPKSGKRERLNAPYCVVCVRTHEQKTARLRCAVRYCKYWSFYFNNVDSSFAFCVSPDEEERPLSVCLSA